MDYQQYQAALIATPEAPEANAFLVTPNGYVKSS
jgi:hypothetical protein